MPPSRGACDSKDFPGFNAVTAGRRVALSPPSIGPFLIPQDHPHTSRDLLMRLMFSAPPQCAIAVFAAGKDVCGIHPRFWVVYFARSVDAINGI